MLNYSVGGLYLSAPTEAVLSATASSGPKPVVVSFAHPQTGRSLRVLAEVTRVEVAHDDAKELKIGIRFDEILPSLVELPESVASVEPPSSSLAAESGFCDSLGFVLDDGVSGRGELLSISPTGLSLAGSLIPVEGTKLKVLMEVDGIAFEVSGEVRRERPESPSSSFAVELNIEAGSRTRELYLLLLEQAEQTDTKKMRALTPTSSSLS